MTCRYLRHNTIITRHPWPHFFCQRAPTSCCTRAARRTATEKLLNAGKEGACNSALAERGRQHSTSKMCSSLSHADAGQDEVDQCGQTSMAADCVGSYCFLIKLRNCGVLASGGHMRWMVSWLLPISASSWGFKMYLLTFILKRNCDILARNGRFLKLTGQQCTLQHCDM